MKSLLVTLADENYIDKAKQLFSSVYFNAGWQGDYMLLAHEIREEKLRWFREKGILVKECKPLFEGKLFSDYPSIILDKFYLFTPEFKKWDNIVFLDADIIVKYSLEKLRNLKGFYATLDFGNFSIKDQFDYKNELFNEIANSFNIKSPAFNTGTLAFNTKIISENSFNEMLNLLYKYEKICRYTEQSILNLYFYKKWKKLNSLYNTSVPIMIAKYKLNANRLNGVLLHFHGINKPWNPTNSFYAEWKENLEKANFIDLNNRKTKNNIPNNKIHGVYINIFKKLFDFYYFIDKQIGKAGIILKKYFPLIYSYLKSK